MYLFKNNHIKLKTLIISCLILSSLNTSVFAADFASKNIEEIDALRSELSGFYDKNSTYYIKTKQKLEKIIQKEKLDYSVENRIDDVIRLINIQNYNAAVYELNDLIENNYEVSKCNELLGDISNRTRKPARKTASYYKQAINLDSENISAQYKLAKLYLREKRNILGIEHLRAVIQKTQDKDLLCEIQKIITSNITPQNRYEANNLYEALGWIYLKLNCENEAFSAFERALELNPSDLYLKYYLADLYYVKNKNNDAINIYSMILEENPKDSQIRLSSAKALENNGNIDSSYKQYLEVLNLNPFSAAAKYGIYKLYKNSEPNIILEKIYVNNKDFKVNKEACLDFAQFLKNKNDFEGAQKFIDFAQKFDIQQPKKEIKQEQNKEQNKSQIKSKINNKEKEPQQIKEQIIKKQPTKEQTTQKQESPKKEVQKETKKEPPKTTKQQTKAPVQKQDKTIKETRKPLKINRTSKKYLEFKKVVEKYQAIEPKDKLTYIAIANTYKLMGELYLAIDNYNNALKLEPTDSDIQYNIGLAYMELNSFETAKIHLEKAINLNPQNQKAINLLAFVNQKLITGIINEAYTKYEKEQYIPAFQILENGIKKFPKTAQLYYYRALVFSKMNRNAAQIIDLQKAIELDPTYYMSYYQLGLAYEKIKDERSALVAYERFLSTEPDEKELVKEVEKKVLEFGKKYY